MKIDRGQNKKTVIMCCLKIIRTMMRNEDFFIWPNKSNYIGIYSCSLSPPSRHCVPMRIHENIIFHAQVYLTTIKYK